MANYTPNYNLKKPEQNEFYNVDDFNGNSDIIDEQLGKKVDKVTGKGLSSNDYTNFDKSKLESIDLTSIENDINDIKGKIPSVASTTNQLADKEFVNSSVSSSSANFVTQNAAGDNFATKSQLDNATTLYYNGVVYTPTKNDYCVILSDETQGGAQTRYSYTGIQWQLQYIVNETPFTSAQNNAINSGITNSKVISYDNHISDNSKHISTIQKPIVVKDDKIVIIDSENNNIPKITSFSDVKSIFNKKKQLIATITTSGVWTCPNGVTEISALLVGGGAAGCSANGSTYGTQGSSGFSNRI